MEDSAVLQIVLLTVAAGACIPLGGFIASFERIHSQWLEKELRHFIIALGGGILLGAVTLVLVPEGIGHLQHSTWSMLFILAGGLIFFLHRTSAWSASKRVATINGNDARLCT